jgi:hypothetical protein
VVLLGDDGLFDHQLQQLHLLPSQSAPLAVPLLLHHLQALEYGHQLAVVLLQVLYCVLHLGELERRFLLPHVAQWGDAGLNGF